MPHAKLRNRMAQELCLPFTTVLVPDFYSIRTYLRTSKVVATDKFSSCDDWYAQKIAIEHSRESDICCTIQIWATPVICNWWYEPITSVATTILGCMSYTMRDTYIQMDPFYLAESLTPVQSSALTSWWLDFLRDVAELTNKQAIVVDQTDCLWNLHPETPPRSHSHKPPTDVRGRNPYESKPWWLEIDHIPEKPSQRQRQRQRPTQHVLGCVFKNQYR
jgi:hypothetical protein